MVPSQEITVESSIIIPIVDLDGDNLAAFPYRIISPYSLCIQVLFHIIPLINKWAEKQACFKQTPHYCYQNENRNEDSNPSLDVFRGTCDISSL